MKSFAEQDLSVAPERGVLTSRAGRWATAQVGRLGRTVSEVAEELGCDWHTVNKEVTRWGDALLEADASRGRGGRDPVLEEGSVEKEAVVHIGGGRGRPPVVGHSPW